MDKKIKTALVATAAAFTAFSVHQVSAAEASDKQATKDTTESLKQVSKQQVSDSEKKVLDTKEAIKQKEANLTQAEADAKVAAEKEKAAAEKAKEATPEAIQKAKDDATTAAEAVKTAEADVKTKKAAQDTLAKDVATKQTEADNTNSAVDAAAKKVQDLENGTPSLTEAEKAKADAEKAKFDAEKAKSDAEKAKESAKKADAAADKKVTDLNNELSAKKQTLADKEKALKDLGEKPQAYDFSDVKFNLGADFAAALNERAKLMGENDPNNTGDGRANELSTRNQAEVTANAEKLKQLAKTNMAKNTYTNTTDTREVDIWDLTAEQKREINLFGLHIVNQIREQLGNPKVKTTVGMEKFANEAADARNKKYAKVTETYAKPYYDGINAAAKANGLSYKTGDDQNQSDIIYANAKTFQKTEDSEVFKSEQNLNTLMKNSPRRPKMTMGQLKEYIFEAYNSKMFTNNEDYTGANSHRAWENALSIGGSIAYRKDGEGNKLGRKASEYNATSVTASVKFNPQPYVNKWGDYRYFTNLEIFVHNFQTAGENKAVGQERNSIVTDSSKFDATEIKNDPTAAKEYSAKKQAAEKAVNDAKADVTKAQNNLETAKQYKAQLPAAEKALTDATNKLTVAEKALTDAEAKLNNLRQDATNRADELNKAKVALATAEQAAEKAKATLTVAQTKLAKAEKDVQAAASLVMTKVAAKDQAEELVRSLENAAKALELAKVAKKNADAKVEELHKSLAEKQTELVKFEEEYKKLLKQYISTLTQPENPELNFYEEVKEEDIKFNIVEELDSSLKEGERVVKIKGINGRKKVKTIVFKSSGEEVGRIVDSEEVLEKPVDEIILVGTKKENLPVQPVVPRDDIKDKANQAVSKSQVVYMAPKVNQLAVNKGNNQKLPTTGMKNSKLSIVLAIIAATTSLGLIARKKEEK
ncbi:SEC10/PgrA surface exclusion domain-containing protein [Streptococcus oralis]|uniref:SEC10/PgrA surface exclusion domain-containing protein n=1 Tax=Streptococcus oralis TaxID=1303 RepID=UPI001CBC4F2B|nr:SEC10/PgrA surface exclusion domain-containing protein [Streptococcus oralis]MBZ2084347.1 SEC10/PgrA surface exclusion domain-containing protein [Streptococcus oralis]MBZ2088876.1 SEC10/PgrA surface exclusion domain-containing protein [Streptococcus oralis]